MAATPSKPSPSHKSSEAETRAATSNTEVAKAPPREATLKATPLTTVSNLKAPPASSIPTYQSSEDSRYYMVAKTLLNDGDFETALTTIEEGIEWTKARLPTDEDNTLHESMAPFHYLYGTTLLYSIEESTEGLQQMTTVESSGEEGGDEEPVEDMEIAWENLDTARTILERMLAAEPENDKLKADLAQVFLREGDLQRQNGAYDAAVADYTACLQYREQNSTIPVYSRKIADVHCNLGLVYFNLVVETKIPEDPVQADETSKKLAFARSRGFYHYYECAKNFGGMLAELCGADPTEMLRKAEQIPQFKSTGDEGDNDDHPRIISMKLRNLRTLVAKLEAPEPAQEEVADFIAVLQEIQETVDEAETSEKGVAEASAMKDEITALVAAQAASEEMVDEATGANNTIGFGSAAAAASTAAAQPVMMMVKKKKKRDADQDGEDTKLPANEPSKRAKSE
jgi:tetratricopeptide (TPR) repeat protein